MKGVPSRFIRSRADRSFTIKYPATESSALASETVRVGRAITTPSSASQSTCLEKFGSLAGVLWQMIEPAVVLRKNQGSAPLVIEGALPVVRFAISAISSRWSQEFAPAQNSVPG